MRREMLVVCLLTLPGLAGCLGDPGTAPGAVSDDAATPVYDTSGGWSKPLTPQKYDVLPGVQKTVASFDGTEIAVGLFLPEIPGCDWDASELPDHCRIPVILEGGPYFLDGVDQVSHRPPKVEWFATRGYAVAQMSLRGTGESGGCFRFKNPDDVRDMDAVIDWLAEQSWSNGNVGMIGRSYDGTAAWAGAASGNPHLETIVPISGAVDGPHLYYKNGTSETRGYIQPTFYYLFAYGLIAGDPTYRLPDWPEVFCPDAAEDWVRGPKAAATGDASSEYWQARDLTDRILDNYEGSAWVIHGLQDWNVNPSQAVPFTSEMRDAGIETLVWLGQWDHAYPDRVDEHRNVRWDWAQRLLEWFDHELKDEGEPPRLGVEVEDSLYTWRWEDRYPPRDAAWETLALGAEGELAPPDNASEGSYLLTGPPSGIPLSAVGGSVGPAGSHARFVTEPLEDDLRIAGLPRLHVTATPTTPHGGHLFAELYDVYPDGRSVRIGWGAINLRFHDGGNTDPATLVPGEPVTAEMQFEPTDAHVGEGHRLRLVLHKAGVEDILPSPSPEASELSLGPDSVLKLPRVDRPDLVPSYTAPRAS